MSCTMSNSLQLLNKLGRLLSRFVGEVWSAHMTEQARLGWEGGLVTL